MKKLLASLVPLSVTICCLCALIADSRVADSAQQICPLLPGTKVPQAALLRADGTSFDLLDEVSQMRTILIFYRGGW